MIFRTLVAYLPGSGVFFFFQETHKMATKGKFMGSNFGSSYYWPIVIYSNINNFITFIIRQFSRPIMVTV
jgi:hypothetical protein